MTLPVELVKLADAFSGFLFETDCLHRISHHMAHVASENWLAAELAYLFNTRADEFGGPGWSALLERKRVDVTLVSPQAKSGQGLPSDTVYLELKLVDTSNWNTAWREVRHDLTRKDGGRRPRAKPTADYAVCLLLNVVSRPRHRQMEATKTKYSGYMDRVSLSSGWFEPTANERRLCLAHTSPEYRLRWERPVFDRWPGGYEAEARLLWVSLGPG